MSSPPTKRLALFGTAELATSLGGGLYYPYALLFFDGLTNVGLPTVGLVLGVSAIAVLPALGWVGREVDRRGPRPMLTSSSWIRALALTAVTLAPSLATLIIASIAMALGNRAEQVGTMALVRGVPGDADRGHWIATWRMTFNLGMGAGALLGSILIRNQSGLRAIGLLNAASFLVFAALIGRLGDRHHTPPTAGAEDPPAADRADPQQFYLLAAANGLLWIVAVAMETALAVDLVDRLAAPAWLAGILFTVNTLIVAGLQFPLNTWLADKHLPRWLLAGCALLLALPAALSVLTTTAGLITLIAITLTAMVATSVGEVLSDQTRTRLLLQHVPADAPGRHLAHSQTMVGLALGVAPILAGALLPLPLPVIWWVLIGLALVAMGLIQFAARRQQPSKEDLLA